MESTPLKDISSLRIHLKELQTQFDCSIREGKNIDNLNVIHSQIKELECHVKAMDWDPYTHRNKSRDSSPSKEYPTEPGRDNDIRRFRHVEEKHPLL